MTESISLTRALVEVKTLDDRIKKNILAQSFVLLSKGIKAKRPINGQFTSTEEASKAINTDYQSTQDLIKRRSKIKTAITKANVSTSVTINGDVMTISEAIDLKTVVEYKQLMLSAMNRQLSQLANNIEQNRIQMEANVQTSITNLLGADGKTKAGVEQNAALIDSTKAAIMEMHDLALIDPLDVKAKIKELNDEIYGIKNEIDFVLSEANASTKIEI